MDWTLTSKSFNLLTSAETHKPEFAHEFLCVPGSCSSTPDVRARPEDGLRGEVLQPVEALGVQLEERFARGQSDVITTLWGVAAQPRPLPASHQHHSQPPLRASQGVPFFSQTRPEACPTVSYAIIIAIVTRFSCQQATYVLQTNCS